MAADSGVYIASDVNFYCYCNANLLTDVTKEFFAHNFYVFKPAGDFKRFY